MRDHVRHQAPRVADGSSVDVPEITKDYSNATLSGLALLLCLTSFVVWALAENEQAAWGGTCERQPRQPGPWASSKVSMMFCMSALVRPKKIETRQMCQAMCCKTTFWRLQASSFDRCTRDLFAVHTNM